MIRRTTLAAALAICSASTSQTTTPRIILQAEEEEPLGLLPPALSPEVQTAEWAQSWWPARHAAKLAERDAALAAGKRVDLVFVGDSITQGWEAAGADIWAERYAPRGAMNLGFSGDRTEQVLWRLGVGEAGEENNEFVGLKPKLIVVMIGTNNTGHRQDPAEETAAGVEAIVDRLHELSPASRVLLLGVFPRGQQPEDVLRRLNVAINERIARLGQRDDVDYLDIGEVFLDEKGVLPAALMPDFLHPKTEGYRLWADAIEPTVARVLAE